MSEIPADWIWDQDAVKDTPSARRGMTLDEEDRLRREGVKIIMEIGKLMKLKLSPTLGPAAVFFHRFYMVNSFQEHPREMAALGCLFLAGKVEETPKKCRDLAVMARNKFPSLYDRHRNLIDEIMAYERIILHSLNYVLVIEMPYRHIVDYVTAFHLAPDQSKMVIQTAWTFVNDSLATNICLCWEPEIIAVALTKLALTMKRLEERPGPNWWDQYVANLPVDMIEEICHRVLDLYGLAETFDFMTNQNSESPATPVTPLS
ncbi:unnamed protein product, partial [Mesorhabditis spiculigera]